MYIGIDLGGTNIAAGLVNEKCEILVKKSRPTAPERGTEALVNDMKEISVELCSEKGLSLSDIKWIGIGTPGSVDPELNMVIYAGNLNFRNTPLGELLSKAAGVPVYLGNDANAGALGEVYAGAAKEYDSALLVTLGTGVGGGIILNKHIYTGHNGMAGEIGHMVIVENGRQCTCGRKGCFEAYASATGLIAMTKESMERNPDSLMWEIAGKIENADGRTAFDAQKRGDIPGTEVTKLYIRYLACGLANLIDILQPSVVCLGGGIAKEGDNLLKPLRELTRKESFDVGDKHPLLTIASLGNDAGIIGAAMLGK